MRDCGHWCETADQSRRLPQPLRRSTLSLMSRRRPRSAVCESRQRSLLAPFNALVDDRAGAANPGTPGRTATPDVACGGAAPRRSPPSSSQAWGREHWLADIVRRRGYRPTGAGRVLEAGCGTGQYGLALALQGYDVDALDYNPAALERARDSIATVARVRPCTMLFQGDLLCLPTPTDAYDLVFNQQVMEYFVDAAQRRAGACWRWSARTKPGGAWSWSSLVPAHPFAPLWRRAGGQDSPISPTWSP